MHNLFLLILFFILDSVVLKAAFSTGKYDFFTVLFVISITVSAIWIGAFLLKLKELIENQIDDLQNLESAESRKRYNTTELEKDVEAIKTAMSDYKEEMRSVLVDKYEEFEKALMENVRDSKLIATILRKSGYADLLNRYDTRIESYLNSIKGKTEKISEQESKCSHKKLNAHNSLVARRSQGIFGYHWFFPKHLRYTETEAPSEE